MKKYFFYIFCLFFSCNNSNNEVKDFIKTFEGTIGKTNVIVKITSNNDDINGDCILKEEKKKSTFKGKISNNLLKFEEFDSNGNMTGKYELNLKNNSRIEGNWSKPNGEQVKKVLLIESNTSFTDFESKINEVESKVTDIKLSPNLNEKDNWIKEINGFYEFKSDVIHVKTGEKFHAELRMVYIQNKTIKFIIDDTRCGIKLSDMAKITGYKKAEFRGSDRCNLYFDFNNNKVTVKSEGCSGHSGTGCFHNWDNEYTKESYIETIEDEEQ